MGMKHYPERIMDRFWSKVDATGECWVWKGYRMPSGYGTFQPDPVRGRMLVHRFIDEHERGQIPDGVVVMHTCDNPSCVNPDHLRRGTQADNLADMREKRRHVDPPVTIGMKHHSNKLSDSEVMEIYRRRASGENGKSLAREYGVSDAMVYDIANGKKWKHLTQKGGS